MLDKLDEPSLSFQDADVKQAIFRHKDVYTLYVNRAGQASLLWSFWWLAVEAPVSEDVSVRTPWRAKSAEFGTPVGYAEISVPDRSAAWVKYQPENDRIDIYLTRYDAELGFQGLQPVGRVKKGSKRVRLLDNVWIERLDDADWLRQFAPVGR